MSTTDVKSEKDVEPSFRGRHWQIGQPNPAFAAQMRDLSCNPLAALILSTRGMNGASFEAYADPKVGKTLPDPFSMQDMEIGAKRISRAIREGQRIGIWSDYDVDGACSAALFIELLRACGHHDYVLRIPDRITEGYGPNTAGLLSMQKDQGCDLICSLDAGIVAFDPLAAAHDAGIEVVVIDHHNAAQDGSLPKGVAIINPNRIDDTSGMGMMCAAGVTFCFFVAVIRELRKTNFFDGQNGRPAERPELMHYLDLVALATVCDVMKLVGPNRAFVHVGLKMLTSRRNPGLAALAEIAGVLPGDPIDEKCCGWVLGPRINAGGRVGASDSGARLLIATDPDEIIARATALHEINVERKELSDGVTEAALASLDDLVAGRDRRLAFAIVEDAHEGVVGISAGKVKEAKDCPAIVVTRDHNGNLKGSARSVADVNIGHIIQDAAASGLILGGGGHGAAGGLSLRDDQVGAFIDFADAEIRKTEYFREGLKSVTDLRIALKDLSVAAIRGLDVMRPYGNGNELPRLVLDAVILEEIKILKEKHFKLTFKAGTVRITGLMWNTVGTPLGDRIVAAEGQVLEVLGTADINTYMGNSSPQFMIEDIRFPVGYDPQKVMTDGPRAAGAEETGLASRADEIAPFGDITTARVEAFAGSPPMTLVTGLVLDGYQIIKDKHLRIDFSANGQSLTAFKWNAAGGDFEDRVRSMQGAAVNAMGQLEINEFRGRKSVQMKLKDIEPDQPELALGGIAQGMGG